MTKQQLEDALRGVCRSLYGLLDGRWGGPLVEVLERAQAVLSAADAARRPVIAPAEALPEPARSEAFRTHRNSELMAAVTSLLMAMITERVDAMSDPSIAEQTHVVASHGGGVSALTEALAALLNGEEDKDEL